MIDKEKTYTTRSGLSTRFYATDCGGGYPVHGAVFENGHWKQCSWKSDGSVLRSGEVHDWDLIEAKPRIKGWLNCYPDGTNYLYSSREEADRYARMTHSKRVACIEIDVPHGYGLEEAK